MGIRRKNVTADQRRRVLELFQDGLNAKAVAKKANLSLSEVHKIRREARKASQVEQLHQEGLQQLLKEWREQLRYLPLDQLLWKVRL